VPSSNVASSFSGLFTRVEIGHMVMWSEGNEIAGIRLWIWATRSFEGTVMMAKVPPFGLAGLWENWRK
jgi:hypothetical protein